MISIRPLAFSSILFVSFFSFSVAAQQRSVSPTPSPTPLVNEDDVVKVTTTLIQMDVTVTDRKGRIIRDLKPEEIEIYENGKKQTITNFSFVSAEKAVNEKVASDVDKTKLPVPNLPVTANPESVRRTIALVVDDLSLSYESAYYVRRSLKKYVDELMQDGDLVAIIRTGAGVGALQQFTADKRMLYAAIERVKWNPLGRGGISAFAPYEPSPSERAVAMGQTEIDEVDVQNERNSMNSFDDFRDGVFAAGTLGALRFIVQGMSELPGRKSVVLLSDGFKLIQRDSNGFTETSRVMGFLRTLVETANRASVVFYTMDARGLQYTGITAADEIINSTPRSLQGISGRRADELFETQAGLAYLAKETGGFDIKNNNDLTGGLRRVVEDQSYYLIGYVPDDETFDAAKRKFNKIEIKVNRPDVNVRYRSGFFNVTDEKLPQPSNKERTPQQHLQYALTSPFGVNEVVVSLNSLYGNDTRAGSYVRSLLHVDASSLKFIDAGKNKRKAEIAILAVSYGDNGSPVDKVSHGYTIEADETTYRRLLKDGFVYNFTFQVKKPGPYQYRVAILDQLAQTVGSASQFIEVPNLKKDGAVLSGIVLKSYSRNEWEGQGSGGSAEKLETSVFNDTASRKFMPGGVLQFAYEIYNAKLDAAKKPNLSTRIRLFRDRELMLDGKDKPYDPAGQSDMQRLKTSGAISLNQDMTPGDYILQIIVTDHLAKEKQRTISHYVTFEVLDPAVNR